MIDLSTNSLGLSLRSPIVASSSPLCRSVDNISKLEQAGAGAVVLHSLFEEQIMMDSFWLDSFLNQGSDSFPEAMGYFPDQQSYEIDPKGYPRPIEDPRRGVNIPVIDRKST